MVLIALLLGATVTLVILSVEYHVREQNERQYNNTCTPIGCYVGAYDELQEIDQSIVDRILEDVPEVKCVEAPKKVVRKKTTRNKTKRRNPRRD